MISMLTGHQHRMRVEQTVDSLVNKMYDKLSALKKIFYVYSKDLFLSINYYFFVFLFKRDNLQLYLN